MYERSAIVLERYFNNILGYFSENNLKVNFENYCGLVEKLDKFQACYEQEQVATQEFEDLTVKLKAIQQTQEKLYKKSAKLEYNRNILFNNIDDKIEDIERCLLKIENDIDKNEETSKNLRMNFINTLNAYHEKNNILVKSQKAKKDSENVYQVILEMAQENADNINEFILEFARNFNGVEVKEKLLKLMIDNGKEEKIPFDEDVINLAVDLGMEITQKEVQCYIDAYDSIYKLFEEIEKGDVKIEKYKRKVRNIKVKLNFLLAEKQYLIQFLDYERMMSINSKRVHKKLMEQACENFKVDIMQIHNLYELILKEIANKSSQKIYKELYNKSYLLQINKEEETLKKEKNKVNSAVATVLGSNYWRIEGIKDIYTVFYKDISEVFGRDLDEFDVPDEEEIEIGFVEESNIDILEEKRELPDSIKIIEQYDEKELPQLISEDEIEEVPEVIPDATEIIKVIETIEKDEKTEIEEIRQKRRRKDIIKEEEENKKATKLKETIKKEKIEKQRVNVIEDVEKNDSTNKLDENDIVKKLNEVEEITEKLEEVRPKRRRKDIIKEEEEEKKKGKTRIKEENPKKKKDEIQFVEKTKEIEEDEQNYLEEDISNVQNIGKESGDDEDFSMYEIDDDESLFGNIKSTRSTRRNNLDLEMLEQLEEKNKNNKKGIFSSLMNMNSKKGKRVAN